MLCMYDTDKLKMLHEEEMMIKNVFLAHLSHGDKVSFCERLSSAVS